jgi:hypothetical protein
MPGSRRLVEDGGRLGYEQRDEHARRDQRRIPPAAVAHDTTLDPDPDPGEDADGPWLRRQWCELGVLEEPKLLPPQGAKPGSALNGDFFEEKAAELLHRLTAKGRPDTADRVTLFTTASGLGPHFFDAYDAAGQQFDVSDHRFLYRFTNDLPVTYHRDGKTFTTEKAPKEPSVTDTKTLALAARASASFPVAFAPVHEDTDLNKVRPPRERPRKTRDGTPSWLMDGGVLGNAPFGPVLDAVSRSPVATHVSRYVLYVVPSSGVGKAATRVGDERPAWWRTAGSALQYPREVDFRSDVEDLEQLRLQGDAAWSDTQLLFDRVCDADDPAELDRLQKAADALLPSYVRGRAAGGLWEAITVSQDGRATVLDRAAAVTDDDIAALMDTQPAWVPAPGATVEATVPQQGNEPLWPWGILPAERVSRLVLRRTRKQLSDAFAAELATGPRPTGTGPSVATLEKRVDAVSTVLANVLAVRDAITPAIVDADLHPSTDPAGTAAAATKLNEIFTNYQVREALGNQMRALQDAVADHPGTPDPVAAAVAVEVVSRCTSARVPDRRSAPFSFVRLGPDIWLPVLTDPVHRKLAEDLGDQILYGTQVGHFGAFGAESWRKWDWLMGRLHAVSHLGTLLHSGDAPNPKEAAEGWVRDTQRLVLAAEGRTEQDLVEHLQGLKRRFPPGLKWNGLGRMIEDLNQADQDRTDKHGNPLRTTIGVGDRLVAFSAP